jgi:hypothetical protein
VVYVPDRYDGPVEVGMVFTAPDNDGKLGYRRVKVIADLGGGTLVLEEMPGRIRYSQAGSIFKCPELNLRIVFEPEEAESDD